MFFEAVNQMYSFLPLIFYTEIMKSAFKYAVLAVISKHSLSTNFQQEIQFSWSKATLFVYHKFQVMQSHHLTDKVDI